MGRYVKRFIYHPISIMSENPVWYGISIIPMAVLFGYPIRFYLADYWERQNQSPQLHLRSQAIRFYQELERMHRRQAVSNHPIVNNDSPTMRTTANNMNRALRMGNVMAEESYFYAHKRDVQRAQLLLGEIRELKVKIAADASTASA